MLKLLHISDLHFGKYYIGALGEALSRCIEAMAPDVLVISGDLTQRAKPREFQAARAYLDDLPAIPRVVVPGNHDVPLYRIHERLLRPHALYRRYIAQELDTVLRLEQGVIVALDSTDPYRSASNGRIKSRQLEFCHQAFTDTPNEAVRIVVVHHHLAPAPDYNGKSVMPKGNRALDEFTRVKVDLILAGHAHRAYVGNSLDVYPGEDRDHGIIIAQCGTTTSRRGRVREREKNSFNWIEVLQRSVRIVHYIYFADAGGFRPVGRYEFARPGFAYLRDRSGAGL